jgi:hypothetical protein
MYTPVLTATQRQFLLDLLSNEASDDLLISAAQETISARSAVRTDMAEIARARGTSAVALLKDKKDDTLAKIGESIKELEARPAPLVEKIPPGEAAARVTTEVKNMILRRLKDSPATTEEINKYINGRLANTARVMKRLWSLKEVQFDGNNFSLKG